MILTAHQPVYLPWLGLFHKIALADRFVSLDEVQYTTNDWNNRNAIRASDTRLLLSVPILTKGHFQKSIREMEINNRVPWRRKHWQSIRQNYRSASYFARYADFFEDLYRRDWPLLAALNHHLLRWLLGTLGIIAGIWSEKFDQLAAFQNFLVMPLTFLAGVFYSMHTLPPFWQSVSKLNPFFYAIDGFRFGFFGQSDVDPWASLGFATATLAALSWTTLRLIRRGYKLRH